MDHSDREVRKLLMDALFQIGSTEAVLAIRAGLKDSSINVRITALEYLGQLNDLDSITDVLEMLQDETDPMLITSALETVLQIGDDASIHKTIKFLNHHGDILKVHPVFLPELIKLVSRCGTVENLLEIIAFLNGRQTYAKDIVQAIGDALKHNLEIISIPEILNRLVRVVKDSDENEGVRYSAAELLLSEESFSDSSLLYELGEYLIKDHSMVHAGIRFLSKSGTKDSQELIKSVLATTKDHDIREQCEELIYTK
ncbi:MAG: HEAT repeat domain-containing protein [Desulfamplus sp.]|nr:HEAT repeat domain-containing protein [Desulfamplus sp.]